MRPSLLAATPACVTRSGGMVGPGASGSSSPPDQWAAARGGVRCAGGTLGRAPGCLGTRVAGAGDLASAVDPELGQLSRLASRPGADVGRPRTRTRCL